MRSSGLGSDILPVVRISIPGTSENHLTLKVLHRDDCRCSFTPDVGAKEVSLNTKWEEEKDWVAGVAACQCHSSGHGCYVDDQFHHPDCWTNKNKDKILEILLIIISFLLTFSAVGGFSFTQALTIVGSHDSVLKHRLIAFNVLFAASFFCNFLGALILLILQSHRQYFPYKNLSLIFSNTASFALLILGYGFVITFNIQNR